MTNQSPSPAFAIVWHIDDSEWEKAAKIAAANPPGSFFDSRGFVLYQLFEGRLQLACDGDLMFKPWHLAPPNLEEGPEEEMQSRAWHDQVLKANLFGRGGLGIADVATSVARIMNELSFEDAPVGTLVAWHNCDDPNAITFVKERNFVRIRHA